MENLKQSSVEFKKVLTKAQMRNVVGGTDDAPAEPTGQTGEIDGGGAGYKCCWAGSTTCSNCIPSATITWFCVYGAVLTAC